MKSISRWLFLSGIFVIMTAGPLLADNGDSPLCEAVRDGDLSMVQMMIDGTNVDISNLNAALRLAVQQKHPEIVRVLLENGASVNIKDHDGFPLIYEAARVGDVEIAMLLMEHGADINGRTNMEYTPLSEAAEFKHADLVNFLLDNGAGANRRALVTAFVRSAGHGYVGLVNSMLKEYEVKADANLGGTTALIAAAKNGHAEVVKLLLENGADVHKEDTIGKTALKYAKDNDDWNVMELLWDAGAIY